MSLLLLLACQVPNSHRLLPTQLSLLLKREDGSEESLVVELGRNLRDQLDLRATAGLRLYDGRHIWLWTPEGWKDQVRGTLLRMPEKGDLVAADRSTVWLRKENQLYACDMKKMPEWAEYPVSKEQRGIQCAPTDQAPSMRLLHPGPGEGFSVWLQEDKVHVRLPADRDPEGQVVLSEISEILGVRWVERPRKAARATLERLFRGQAVLTAPSLPVEVDGDLREWSHLDPLVVEKEWHLQEGGAFWTGLRDASFSVVSAWTGHRLCFAGRIRDDDREAGDHFDVFLGEEKWEVPLGGLLERSHAFLLTPQLELSLRRDWFGAHYEFCLSPSSPLQRRYAFSFSWTDMDAGQPPTIISTAPASEGPPLGGLIRQEAP